MMHALVTEWRRAWGQGDLPWSATDHYPDELEAKLHETGIKAFMIAKTDGLSRALHPLNKWQYAQKHLDNILPTVYGKESPFQKSTGAQEPGHAKPAGGDVVLSKAARADELAKSAHAALKRASKLTSPVNKEAREKEVAAAAAAFREAMTIHPRWAIEGVDEKNPWAVAAARKARADLWSGIGEFEKARAEHHEALAKIGSQLDAKSYIQMLIGDLYKQEQNWAKAEEFYLAAQKTGLYGDRKVLVPRHLEEVRKLMVESGGLKIAGVFGDHMVLQCQAKVPVWGEGVPGGAVTVCFNGQIKTTSVDADRKWIVRLDEMEANQTPQEMTISAANEKVKFRDVLIGEVWLGSGQSNMAGKTVSYAKNDAPLAKMAEQSIPTLRLYRGGKWTSATPEVSRDFSALMFAFGVRLHSELGQPVGMIVAAVGGTPSGDWVTAEMLEADQPYQAAVKRQMERAAGDANFNQAMKKHEEALAAWKKSVEDAEKAGQKVDPTNKPQPPLRPGESRGKIGGLYEKHIHPIVGFGIRGVLWDQGEQGTGIEKIYNDTVTPALIQGWRTDWGQGEFPFLYVQKQSGGGCAWNPEDPVTAQADKFQPLPAKPPHISAGIWKELHIRIGRASNTAMVTCTDLGGGIHPPNKSGYGTRAAQVALGFVYKRPLEYQGPTYASHVVEGSAIRVRFDHVGQGLAAAHSETLQGFMIAGEDKVFHWADAVIDGDSVVLRSPAVSQPASARYAWSEQFPWANLFNKDGLPALTFRTDNW
jgi:sialate O-acetylesterase